jgi:hypothetical protein
VIGSAGGGDDARTDVPGKLDGEAGHATGTAVNQDGFAGLKLQRVLDRHERGKTNQAERCGVPMRQGIRLARHDVGLDGDLFGVGAFLAGAAHAEHGIADAQIAHADTERAHHARKIPPQDVRKVLEIAVASRPHLPVGGVDAGGMNVHHHLARPGRRVRQVAILQDLRSTAALDIGCLHRSPAHSQLRSNEFRADGARGDGIDARPATGRQR